MKEEKEMVNHPQHYNGDSQYECIKVLKAWMSEDEYRGFLRGNAIKYICRLGKKDEAVQELKKAAWYIDKLIESFARDARKTATAQVVHDERFEYRMVEIPGTNYMMGVTPVTQEIYEQVIGENPSWFRDSNKCISNKALAKSTSNYPVENVSWYDAVYFCNKLSMMGGFTPAYSVDGETDPEYWGYTPHKSKSIKAKVECDFGASGYRLPTREEWKYAAKGGMDYTYSGSDNLDEVGWYHENSKNITHPVAQKKPNDYGLYDMSGNVNEWVWGPISGTSACRSYCGGSYFDFYEFCTVSSRVSDRANNRTCFTGFRLLRLLKG